MAKLIVLVKPLTPVMILAIIMGVIGFLTAIFIPVIGTIAILSNLGINSSISLKTAFIMLGICAFTRGLLRYTEQACNHYIAFKLLALIRDKVFTALRNLAPAKLESKDKGNLISIITSDIELLEVFYAHTISPVCIAIIISIIMSIFIASYNLLLGVIAMISYITIGIVLPYYISKKSNKLGAKHREKFGNLNTFFLDSLRGLNEIIQFNNTKLRLEKIKKQSKEMSNFEKNLKNQSGNNFAISGFLIMFFTLLTLLTSAYLYKNGEININAVIIPTIAISSSFGSVIAVANLGSGLSSTIAAGNRVLNLLEESPTIKYNETGISPEFEIAKFKNVNFSYNENKVLNNFNVELKKGNITGIIGKSGSGKSTMLKLLMRFWDINSGKIEITNTDIKSIKTSSLRNMQSFVTQETVLFKDTIANNIKIAKLDAKLDEIISACKKASIHDFIISLPKKYETEIGELGSTLSGGEKQRIGLARAFLHNSPLILLDEPTSNLDSLNEAVILKSIKEDKERTTVLVSHRKSTMTIADKIFSVENGRVC
ncbi:MAG: ABC transporter ATP-binding protein [Clostridiales bacterium]|nr:MAG: ABC transporter ATP-binding protein [Clostridiales bacterium]